MDPFSVCLSTFFADRIGHGHGSIDSIHIHNDLEPEMCIVSCESMHNCQEYTQEIDKTLLCHCKAVSSFWVYKCVLRSLSVFYRSAFSICAVRLFTLHICMCILVLVALCSLLCLLISVHMVKLIFQIWVFPFGVCLLFKIFICFSSSSFDIQGSLLSFKIIFFCYSRLSCVI